MANRLFGALIRKLSQPAHRKIRRAVSFILSLCFLGGIAFVVFLSIKLFARTVPVFGILFSTIISCVLMFPVSLLAAPLILPIIHRSMDGYQEQIESQQKQISELSQQNQMLEEMNKDYNRRLMLLENITFNIGTYKDVFKACFRDYRQFSTIKQREKFNEHESHVFSNKRYDEVLSVIDCAVSYQRGFDLQKVRVSRINEDTVVVSGIEPEFISEPRFEYKDFCSEIRRVELDKSDEVRHVSILSNSTSQKNLAQKRNQYKALFEEEFINGTRQDEDSAEIVKKAQDCVKIILQPIYRHVEFDDNKALDAKPLLELLNEEINLCRCKIEAQSSSNENGTKK